MQSEDPVNILLVDDQPNNLTALEAILAPLGQNLVKARSGEEALRLLLDRDFAVILLDVKMPGLDGFEAAGLIRQRRRSEHTPIIFLTAYDHSDAQLVKAYSLGAVDFLSKPLVPEILRSKVAVFVELHRKTEEVKRQADLLRAKERQEHERRLAEEKQRWEMEWLREEAAREQDANRRKDEFLAMLAHELRNPLAPILHALSILRLGTDGPAGAQAREIMERQVRHMARLVDDLLDVSRITRGKIELRVQPVELAAVVDRVVESTRPLVEAQSHRLEVTLPPGPVRLLADPVRLEQVLANLVNNAAKYTDPGGRIWLTAAPEDGELVFRVRDTGIGIPPELLPRVFDLFTQADAALDRSRGGLGIGLTLVKNLVRLHGGIVEARSEGPGLGSEFLVRLPLGAEQCPQKYPKPETPWPNSEGQPGAADAIEPAAEARRLLVVDDNEDAAQTLAALLTIAGHQVRVVHDGLAALEAADSYHPEAILLDIGLPGMSGHEVARQLRERTGPERPLLIALTGYGQEEDRRRSLEAGFDCHLVKPVDPPELLRLLGGACP
jgi:signal transduction histidine kinase